MPAFDFVAITDVIDTLTKAAREYPSIDDICKECLKRNIAVTQPIAAAARRDYQKGVRRSVPVLGLNGETFREGKVTASAETLMAINQAEALEKQQAEREQQKQRAAEREKEWQERAERQQQELEQEQKKKEQEQVAQVPVIQLTEQAPPAASSSDVVLIEPRRPYATPRVVTRPAPKPTKQTKQNAKVRAEKRAYVNELLDADPALTPQVIMGKVFERFGRGLGWDYVYETCRVSRELHQLPLLQPLGPHARPNASSPEPLPKFVAPGSAEDEADEEEFAATPDEDVQWLMEQARDIMRQHNLTQLTITLAPEGGDWECMVAPRVLRGSVK